MEIITGIRLFFSFSSLRDNVKVNQYFHMVIEFSQKEKWFANVTASVRSQYYCVGHWYWVMADRMLLWSKNGGYEINVLARLFSLNKAYNSTICG